MTSKDSKWRMVCSLITESESLSSLATSASNREETEKENHLWLVISHRDFINQRWIFQIQIWNLQIRTCPWVRRLSKPCFLFSLLVGHAVLRGTPPLKFDPHDEGNFYILLFKFIILFQKLYWLYKTTTLLTWK